MIETLLLAPLAGIYIIYKMWLGSGALFTISENIYIYLIITGIATTLPLYWFQKEHNEFSYRLLSFMQYLDLSLMLLIGIFVYGETFHHEQAIAFSLIWFALILYSISMIRKTKSIKKKVA
ncbi:hypothetical protein [Ancylomarina longa]|uniref:Uncharacterized protein n=1 Tax=Ancylomarina longa TaxID=2487017 RepID=A0A434ATL8_9BACT|nr:hypothetical protein [Ancylomarina longa]RUT77662.1 hypothetical protein DLK05_12085 [Ancylomarina longa]